MIRSRTWSTVDTVYHQSRNVGTLAVAPKPPQRPTLPADTVAKLRTRPFVFLSEYEIMHCLTASEQDSYLRKCYTWLWDMAHVGPFWLARLCHAYVHRDTLALEEGYSELLPVYDRLIANQLNRTFGPVEKAHREQV